MHRMENDAIINALKVSLNNPDSTERERERGGEEREREREREREQKRTEYYMDATRKKKHKKHVHTQIPYDGHILQQKLK